MVVSFGESRKYEDSKYQEEEPKEVEDFNDYNDYMQEERTLPS